PARDQTRAHGNGTRTLSQDRPIEPRKNASAHFGAARVVQSETGLARPSEKDAIGKREMVVSSDLRGEGPTSFYDAPKKACGAGFEVFSSVTVVGNRIPSPVGFDGAVPYSHVSRVQGDHGVARPLCGAERHVFHGRFQQALSWSQPGHRASGRVCV